MYSDHYPRQACAWLVLACCTSASLAVSVAPRTARCQQPNSVVRNISQANERLEMIVNTSQILTLDTRIPRIVVNNPDLVTATPVSENQVQIAARKPGVTQINLWNEKGEIYTVDLLIFGDVRELEVNLKRMFPSSSLRVIRLTNSLVLEGQVDRPEIVSTIRQLAEDYAPKVVNNITVGGAQQVLLKVKVMEVSRTKLREAGFDFNQQSGGSFFTSAAGGAITNGNQIGSLAGRTNIQFGIVDGNNTFFGFLQFLSQRNMVKTLADPTLVTVSGRPASFNAGGEIFFQISNGVSGTTVESEKFGTQVDFLPIVLGNGRVRLEVRPKISDIDNSAQLGNELFRTRLSEVDTGVEMMAGQTLALAGLIQTKVNTQKRGIPYLMDVPYVGAAFRSVKVDEEEVELLIMVTPEFADAMDPHEVPPCGPGMETMSPRDCDLYFKGHMEVPACGPCGASDPCACNAPGLACQVNGFGPCGGPGYGEPAAMATDAGGSPQPTPLPSMPQPYDGEVYPGPDGGAIPQAMPAPSAAGEGADPSAGVGRPQWQGVALSGNKPPMRYNRAASTSPSSHATSTPGLIGPIGYDVQK
jgi:pilus assembly protein CpaC